MQYGNIYKVVKCTPLHDGGDALRRSLLNKEVMWLVQDYGHPTFLVEGKHVKIPFSDTVFVRASAFKKKSLRSILTEAMVVYPETDTNTADFALKWEKKGVVLHLNKPCHAELRRVHREPGKPSDTGDLQGVALYLKSWYRAIAEGLKPAYLKYVQWVLSESPWRVCFKTKTASIAVEKGVAMNTDRNVSELMGAAIVLREGWEFSRQRLKMFNQAIEMGATGNTAYLVACFVAPSTTEQYSLQSVCSGHMVLYQAMEAAALLEFFRSGYVGGRPAIRTDATQTSYDVYKTICERRNDTDKVEASDNILTYVTEILKPTVEGEGWGKRSYVTLPDIQRLVQHLNKDMKK